MKEKKLNKIYKIFGIFAFVLLVLIIVLGIFFSMNTNKGKNEKINISESNTPISMNNENIEINYNIDSDITAEEYSDICSSISTKEEIIDFIETLGIEQDEKDKIIQSFDGPKDVTENIILEKLGEADELQDKNIRLQLSTLFVKFNELDSGESKNCDEIYSQYNK